MNGFLEIANGLIETHGYSAIFWLTTTEQFIQPIPADVFIGMGTGFGLSFSKVLWVVLIAAFIGSLIGYYLGKYLGHPVMLWLFGQKRIDKGEAFIRKWGIWGVIIAGLTPIPFKIVTWTAGIFEMPLGRYILGVLIGRMPRYLLTAYAGALIIKTKFYASMEMSAILLGALQGITEFLPISSSGHLALTEHFLKVPIPAAELALFDIFLHGGSLLAIVLYFWRDWVGVFKELWQMIQKRTIIKNSLALKLALGTIPAIIVGLMFDDLIQHQLRGLVPIALAFLLLSLFFIYSEWKGRKSENTAVNLKQSVLIGIAQSVALVPGISRAGSTIGAGMLLGIKREAAAKFSFMLGGVALLAANVYALASLNTGAAIPNLKFTLIGFATSFVVSLMAVSWLIKYLKKHTLLPFSFYLMILGTLILTLF